MYPRKGKFRIGTITYSNFTEVSLLWWRGGVVTTEGVLAVASPG